MISQSKWCVQSRYVHTDNRVCRHETVMYHDIFRNVNYCMIGKPSGATGNLHQACLLSALSHSLYNFFFFNILFILKQGQNTKFWSSPCSSVILLRNLRNTIIHVPFRLDDRYNKVRLLTILTWSHLSKQLAKSRLTYKEKTETYINIGSHKAQNKADRKRKHVLFVVPIWVFRWRHWPGAIWKSKYG